MQAPTDLTALLRLATQLSPGQPAPAQHAELMAHWARLPPAARQQHLATLAALADVLAAPPGGPSTNASFSAANFGTASSATPAASPSNASTSTSGPSAAEKAAARDPVLEWQVLNGLLEELYRAEEDVPQTLPAVPGAGYVPRIGPELRAYLGETCEAWERWVGGGGGM